MNWFCCCNIFSLLAVVVNISGEKCDSSISNPSLTWNKGQKGELKFLVPSEAKKWRIEILFDSPVASITAWQGTKERCIPNKEKCVFENESWNGKKNSGDSLEIGYQINFDTTSTPPRMKKVLFKYCDSEPCTGWKKHVVCQGTSLPDIALTTTTSMPITSPIVTSEITSTEISGNILINGNFENEETVGWECNGCEGSVVSPGFNSQGSYLVQQRKASWSGPRQKLSVDKLSSEISRYKFGYNAIANSSVELKWKFKVCTYDDDTLAINH